VLISTHRSVAIDVVDSDSGDSIAVIVGEMTDDDLATPVVVVEDTAETDLERSPSESEEGTTMAEGVKGRRARRRLMRSTYDIEELGAGSSRAWDSDAVVATCVPSSMATNRGPCGELQSKAFLAPRSTSSELRGGCRNWQIQRAVRRGRMITIKGRNRPRRKFDECDFIGVRRHMTRRLYWAFDTPDFALNDTCGKPPRGVRGRGWAQPIFGRLISATPGYTASLSLAWVR
jgi:hypothetical protein